MRKSLQGRGLGERDPRAWRARAKGKQGRTGGKKIQGGAASPGWPQRHRKTGHRLSLCVLQDVNREADRAKAQVQWSRGGCGERNGSVTSASSLSMVKAYASELCQPNVAGGCRGVWAPGTRLGQTGRWSCCGSRGPGKQGCWARRDRGSGGRWSLATPAGPYTGPVRDVTLIVNHLSWLHVNPLSTYLNFNFTIV